MGKQLRMLPLFFPAAFAALMRARKRRTSEGLPAKHQKSEEQLTLLSVFASK
jgi:hypothetical protein